MPLRSGRDRPMAALEGGVDDGRFDSGHGQRPHRPGPFRTGVPGPPHRGGRPHQAVVAEPGDHLGRAVQGRIPRHGSNQRSTRSSKACTRSAEVSLRGLRRRRPGPPASCPGRSAGCSVGHRDRPAVVTVTPHLRHGHRRAADGAAEDHGRLFGSATVGRAELLEAAVVAERGGPGPEVLVLAGPLDGRPDGEGLLPLPAEACSEGSAVMVMGSLRWSSLTCTGPPPEDLLAQAGRRCGPRPASTARMRASEARPVL